jgi:hypothetical protein
MRYAIVEANETLHALVKRVFTENAPGGLQRAEKAVRGANPAVDPAKPAAGAVVLLPEVDGATPTSGVTTMQGGSSTLLFVLDQAAQRLGVLLEKQAQELAEEATETLARGQDQELLKSLAGRADEAALREAMRATIEGAQTSRQRAEALREANARAVEELRKDVETLTKRLG